jgi:hypothetical protein
MRFHARLDRAQGLAQTLRQLSRAITDIKAGTWLDESRGDPRFAARVPRAAPLTREAQTARWSAA